MAPEELEDALLVADIMPPGELPRWHRGRDDSEPPRAPDPAFEAELETLKHGESDPAEARVVRPRASAGSAPWTDFCLTFGPAPATFPRAGR
jgi:hypothetical protein